MSTTDFEFAAPPRVPFEVDVGPADVERFARDGYLVIERITSDAELAWLRDVYDALIARPRSGFPDTVFDLVRPYGVTAEPKVGQLLFPERLVPAIRQTSMWNNAQRIAAQLLARPLAAVESWGHLIFKTAGGDAPTPWHQDEAYWSVDLDYHAVGSWMALDAATVESGCLWFLPGSHRSDVLQHRHLGGDPAVHVLELDEPLDTSSAVAAPIPAGGMTFHAARTIHYAGPNRSGGIRRAWANEFQTAPVERTVPAPRPWVAAGNAALEAHWSQRKR